MLLMTRARDGRQWERCVKWEEEKLKLGNLEEADTLQRDYYKEGSIKGAYWKKRHSVIGDY